MCRSKSRWGEGQSGFWRGQKTSLSKRSWKSSPRALHVAVVGEQSKWQKQSLTGKAATLVAGDGGATTSTRPHLFYQLWHSSNNFPCVSLYWQAQYPQPFEAKAASNSSTNAYVVRLPTTEVSQQESKYITQMQIFKLLLRHLPPPSTSSSSSAFPWVKWQILHRGNLWSLSWAFPSLISWLLLSLTTSV